MSTLILSFAVIAIAVLGMAVGVLFGRQSIKGTCGGLNKVKGLEGSCPACSGQCDRKTE